jgi:flagellar biogenesis protein FliO
MGVDLKNFIFAVLLFAAPLTVLCLQAQDGAAITDESELKLDAPLTVPGSDDAVREAERAYPLEGGGDLQGGVTIWAVLRIFLTLLIVALAIYGILYFFKYYKKNKGEGADSAMYLKVLATAPINAKTAAALISVGKKAWLVGLADSSVSLIAEISDQETVDMMLLDYSQRAALTSEGAIPNFFAALQRFIPVSGNKPAEDTINTINTADKLRKNRDRLHKL